MSSNSRARDIYEAKMAGRDAAETLRMLLESPYRKHQLRGQRILKLAQMLDEIRKENPESEILKELQEAHDAAAV